jgi:hypothetical protein
VPTLVCKGLPKYISSRGHLMSAAGTKLGLVIMLSTEKFRARVLTRKRIEEARGPTLLPKQEENNRGVTITMYMLIELLISILEPH